MSTKNFLEISSLRAAREVRFATKRHNSSKRLYDTIRYDTIEEFNVDSKAEYTA